MKITRDNEHGKVKKKQSVATVDYSDGRQSALPGDFLYYRKARKNPYLEIVAAHEVGLVALDRLCEGGGAVGNVVLARVEDVPDAVVGRAQRVLLVDRNRVGALQEVPDVCL
jgi:hypothetical protein